MAAANLNTRSSPCSQFAWTCCRQRGAMDDGSQGCDRVFSNARSEFKNLKTASHLKFLEIVTESSLVYDTLKSSASHNFGGVGGHNICTVRASFVSAQKLVAHQIIKRTTQLVRTSGYYRFHDDLKALLIHIQHILVLCRHCVSNQRLLPLLF